MIRNIEFFISPSGKVMVQRLGCEARELTENDRELIDEMFEYISTFYTDSFNALKEVYQQSIFNERYYKFLIARRFIKCNFGQYASPCDVDEFGVFNFEFVPCPLRGECKYEDSICNPKFNSSLSGRELEVMKLYASGKSVDVIAGMLFISINTVKNHIKNAFRKVGVHSLAEFIQYANSHNLIKS